MRSSRATWLLLVVLACDHARHSASPPVTWSPAQPGLDLAHLEPSPGIEVWAVRYDQSVYELSIQWAPTGLRVPSSLPPGYAAAVNGGFFEPDLRPSGLLIVDGREVHAASGHHGALVLDEGRARLVHLRDLRAGPTASVLQAWPFLIEPGGSSGIHADDHKLSRRSAFALDAQGRGLLIAAPTEGVSLYQLMEICRRLGAVAAVNLDGGPSTGFSLGVPPGWRSDSATDVSNVLVLRSRTDRSARPTQAQAPATAPSGSPSTYAL